jgi:hypothetical protein
MRASARTITIIFYGLVLLLVAMIALAAVGK